MALERRQTFDASTEFENYTSLFDDKTKELLNKNESIDDLKTNGLYQPPPVNDNEKKEIYRNAAKVHGDSSTNSHFKLWQKSRRDTLDELESKGVLSPNFFNLNRNEAHKEHQQHVDDKKKNNFDDDDDDEHEHDNNDILKSLNDGILSSSIFLPYKQWIESSIIRYTEQAGECLDQMKKQSNSLESLHRTTIQRENDIYGDDLDENDDQNDDNQSDDSLRHKHLVKLSQIDDNLADIRDKIQKMFRVQQHFLSTV